MGYGGTMSQRGPRDWTQRDAPLIVGRGSRGRAGGSLSRAVWLSLIALPLAVACWILLESVGLITTLVSYLYAVAAIWLFRRGSGGVISPRGARAITVVITAGVVVSVAASAIWASATAYSAAGVSDAASPFAAIVSPGFWAWFWQAQVATGDVFLSNAVTLLLGLLFAAAGVLPILLAIGRRPLTPWASIALSAGLLVAATVVVVVANQFPVGTSGPIAVSHRLAVGECLLDVISEPDAPTGVVGCDQPHRSEVFAQVVLPGNPNPGYPDESWFAAAAPPGCEGAFAGFIGHPVEGSTLQLTEDLPAEADWAAGDRTVFCVVSDPATSISSSLAWAKR